MYGNIPIQILLAIERLGCCCMRWQGGLAADTAVGNTRLGRSVIILSSGDRCNFPLLAYKGVFLSCFAPLALLAPLAVFLSSKPHWVGIGPEDGVCSVHSLQTAV